MIEIWIPGNCPSSKNSKIATSRGVFHSKTVSKYLRNLGIQHFSPSKKTVKEYKTKPNLFRKAFENSNWKKPDKQVIIGFHYVRGTRHKFDWINILQLTVDLMVSHDYLEDDNMDYLVPKAFKKEGGYYSYNKENPGVYIRLYEPK